MWSNPQETSNLVIVTEEIPKEKRHFLCSGDDLCQTLTTRSSYWATRWSSPGRL